MPDSRIVGRMSLRGLHWQAWRELDDSARLEVARGVIAAIRAAAPVHRLGEPSLEEFGPPDERQTIAIVQDVEREVWFALIPGGRLEPGLGPTALRRFRELESAWLEALDYPPGEHQLPYTADAWSPAQLERGAPVDVEPMLVAIQPLSHRVLQTAAPRYSARPLLMWEEARSAAARLGYDLPTSRQLEWATTAGVESLFYWGDALPAPMDPRSTVSDWEMFEIESEQFAAAYMALAHGEVARWPTSNRFGLQGTAGQPVWCEGPGGEPLVAGGADRYFPWQGCGEWLWLLSALRVDARFIANHQGAMIRPAITVPIT